MKDDLKRVAAWHEKSAAVSDAKAAQLEHQGEKAMGATYRKRAEGHRAYATICSDAAEALAGAPKPPPESPEFRAFWAAYPSRRKTNRPGCLDVWKRKKLDTKADAVMEGLKRAMRSADWKKEGGEFIPGPHPWLRREGWTDEAATPGAALTDANADPARWREFIAQCHEKPARPEYRYAKDYVKADFAQWLKGKRSPALQD